MFWEIKNHEGLSGLSFYSLMIVARLIPHLKQDILQPQTLIQSDFHVAPLKLSSSFILFLSSLLCIPDAYIPDLWTIIREEVWELPIVPLSKVDYGLFKEHSWRYGISCVPNKSIILDSETDRWSAAISIYPPNHNCANLNCQNPNPLKKEEQRQVVVYTLSDGVQPAWNVHLYCASEA